MKKERDSGRKGRKERKAEGRQKKEPRDNKRKMES